MIFGKTTVRDDLLLGSRIVLVLAVVLVLEKAGVGHQGNRSIHRRSGAMDAWSRFIMWQLYRLLADGSRERLDVWQFYRLQ